MPECPEIKLNVDLVQPLVQNKLLTDVQIYSTSRYQSAHKVDGLLEFLQDKQAKQVWTVKCKGKFIYWTFGSDVPVGIQNENTWYAFNTFAMTGQYSPKKGKHPCFSFHFEDGTNIFFNDPRHFGTIKFVKGESHLLNKLNTLGWDPLQGKLNDYWDGLVKYLNSTNKPIAQVLMDQFRFAGVGNYIKCESLYLSQISPWRPCNKLSKQEIDNLCQSIIQVVNESYQHQGATINTYKNFYDEEGKYSGCFKVYGKKLDPNQNKIVRETTPDKRSTYWVPNLQK